MARAGTRDISGAIRSLEFVIQDSVLLICYQAKMKVSQRNIANGERGTGPIETLPKAKMKQDYTADKEQIKSR